MRVTPIASTSLELGDTRFLATEEWMETDPDATEAEHLVEFAGRSCYQSWSKPNPKTATNAGYIENIVQQGHFSVLEHASVTFYVEGVSRNLTHELVRHRHLSFSELSQRFVDLADANLVVPPALEILRDRYAPDCSDHELAEQFEVDTIGTEFRQQYREDVEFLESEGFSRKRAREAARFALPQCVETRIVVTGNLRAWRDFLHKRHTVHADAEMQLFAKEVLTHMQVYAPNTFADIPGAAFG